MKEETEMSEEEKNEKKKKFLEIFLEIKQKLALKIDELNLEFDIVESKKKGLLGISKKKKKKGNQSI